MKQRLLTALIATFVYFVIANLGNLVFSVTEGIVSTLWESLFLIRFLLLDIAIIVKIIIERINHDLKKIKFIYFSHIHYRFLRAVTFSGISPMQRLM